MRLNQKRQADKEPVTSPASKRQATGIAPKHMTRSFVKRNASIGIIVHLNPGLPMAPRERKKKPLPSSACPQTPVQPECAPPVDNVSLADSADELMPLPATTNMPVKTHKPNEKAPAAVKALPSVVCATGTAMDGQNICTPVQTVSRHPTDRQGPKVLAVPMTSGQSMANSGHACPKEAANAGGPAPVADMGGDIQVHRSTDISSDQAAQCISSQEWCREPSHSSLISPLTGPALVCSIPESSRAGGSRRLSRALEPINKDSSHVLLVRKIMLDWAMLSPRWVKGGAEVWQATRRDPKPAVTEASYSVDSSEEAAVLLANEMDAQSDEQDVAPFLIEMLAPGDLSAEDTWYLQMKEDFESLAVVSSASNSSVDAMDWIPSGKASSVPGLPSDAVRPGLAMLTEYINNYRPASIMKSFSHHAYSPPPGGLFREWTVKNVLPMPPMSPMWSTKHVIPSTESEVLSLPEPQQKTLQQEANLQREKELRARLIEMRRCRKTAPPPPCVHNVLVREADGSMSIVTTQNAHMTNWRTEEDQYSVEEYEEDTVSY